MSILESLVWRKRIGVHPYCNNVTSVAYSPDGSHIVSASQDKTIRVWGAATVQCVIGPFQGHTGIIASVSYSPDGSHIVSASQDKTIRVWNAATGQCVAGPFQGHTDFVTSVAYSPDGSHIVSGSWNKTIRFGMQPLASVWQVLSRGTLVL